MDFDDGVINIEQRIPHAGRRLLRVAQQPGQPSRRGKEAEREGVELPNMAEGEFSQKRPRVEGA